MIIIDQYIISTDDFTKILAYDPSSEEVIPSNDFDQHRIKLFSTSGEALGYMASRSDYENYFVMSLGAWMNQRRR